MRQLWTVWVRARLFRFIRHSVLLIIGKRKESVPSVLRRRYNIDKIPVFGQGPTNLMDDI
ncbi:MAG: hypothetical protein LBF68_03235 [Christensenellaceae bacterium]|nr:hypothetical protein [Christensenellaceae bacterium]